MKWALTLLIGSLSAFSQGTFNPATYSSDPNFDHSAGTVFVDSGPIPTTRVDGSTYVGQYYIGPANTTDPNALVAVGPVAPFMGSSPSDPSAGYYNGDGSGSVSTSFVPGSSVVVQLRAWKGSVSSTFNAAAFKGTSSLLTITLGNAGSPPSLPTAITSMQNFIIATPEPSTIALGLIGAAALFVRRRHTKTMFMIALLAVPTARMYAQGTFNPATYNSDPSFDHSGGTVILYPGGPRVYGNGYQGQYYFGPAGTTDPNALVAVGIATGFMGASAVDPAAGYYQGDGSGSVSIPNNPGGTQVVLLLRAWQGGPGSTYEGATSYKGSSGLISMTLGNAGSPPSLPTAITTMQNFAIGSQPSTPEPTTIVLGFMGAGALFIRRRNPTRRL
jgi:hypothetical protein